MALQYCEGSPLQAERTFGWSRRTVALGRAERRSGIMCLGAQSAFRGRTRWAKQQPDVAVSLRQLAESHAQQAPTFRTTLASTRLTANAAREALRGQGYGEDHVPSPSTMAAVRNRMGFRLRKVLKAKPPKKIAQTAAMFAHREKQTLRQCHRTRSDVCVALVRRR